MIIASRLIQATLYILAGVNHFLNPSFYYKIIPPFLSHFSYSINIISGLAEIALGVMLLSKKTRRLACIGLIILLIAVFPANIYLALENGVPLDTRPWIAWARLPMQFVLMYWAYYHLKKDNI